MPEKICLEDTPTSDVVYGEDQLWAREILRKGYKKAYASTAVVRHSHEYGFRETVIRANTEWHFYNQLLGENLPSTKEQVCKWLNKLVPTTEMLRNYTQTSATTI